MVTLMQSWPRTRFRWANKRCGWSSDSSTTALLLLSYGSLLFWSLATISTIPAFSRCSPWIGDLVNRDKTEVGVLIRGRPSLDHGFGPLRRILALASLSRSRPALSKRISAAGCDVMERVRRLMECAKRHHAQLLRRARRQAGHGICILA